MPKTSRVIDFMLQPLSAKEVAVDAQRKARARDIIRANIGQVVALLKQEQGIPAMLEQDPVVRVLITVDGPRVGLFIVYTLSVDGAVHHTAALVSPMCSSDRWPQNWRYEMRSEQSYRDAAEALKLMLCPTSPSRRVIVGRL